jgi:hypothetical protein
MGDDHSVNEAPPCREPSRQERGNSVVGYFHFETAGTARNYFAYNFIKIHRTLRMSP